MDNFEFIFALNRAVHVFNNYIDARIIPDTGLSRAQYIALLLIDRFPNITKAELARKLSCSHVAIGRLAKILIEHGYIESHAGKQNPHAAGLIATSAGKGAVVNVRDIFDRESASIFAGIKGDVDISMLSTQLAQFTEAVVVERTKA